MTTTTTAPATIEPKPRGGKVDPRAFPQRRNGVLHQQHGAGVVQIRLDLDEGSRCLVKFDRIQTWVLSGELSSMPSRAVSPDPKTHRNSGWVSGSYGDKRDLKIKGGVLSRSAERDISSNGGDEPLEETSAEDAPRP